MLIHLSDGSSTESKHAGGSTKFWSLALPDGDPSASHLSSIVRLSRTTEEARQRSTEMLAVRARFFFILVAIAAWSLANLTLKKHAHIFRVFESGKLRDAFECQIGFD